MTGTQQRRPVSDRARKRAIRTLAAQLGVAYSVAARLLTAHMTQPAGGAARRFPTGADQHRAWLFAMRERRPLDLRLRDTRLAADLPLGRAAHLAERFPRLRLTPSALYGATLYDGEGREAMLAMLYAVLAPSLAPGADTLAWVGELGEETAVDLVCAELDRAARLLLDEDPWRLFTRIEAALDSGGDQPRTLRQELCTLVPRKAMQGARQTLDALLVAAHDGHPPGTPVRILAGPRRGALGVVVGAHWQRQGPPTHYDVRTADNVSTLSRPADTIDVLL